MSNFSSTPIYVYTENIAVSTIMAVVGMFGLVSNGAAMIAIRCNPTLRNSFGLLCLSHCIVNSGFLLVFVFWITPTTLL
ncbi:hypothetical protein KIN20_033428 [Parelaphostrongylus tenuis]|uniref:7TM GPCR serpentine receptor class x (Srx) domain-containing protein n=1 Tax=Parelaphostrongylus tenuis TaxID=148309 RepID=A0AAD5R8N5_PARTN|nr:hypothetical protein KIN20_033428 [Parelaphostrongylus tenuis]